MTRTSLIGLYLGAMLAIVAGVNLVLPHLTLYGIAMPEYGTWMGVIEVERKVRLLRDFAHEGEVDALILSSSTGDLGLSAEVLTRELSAAYGRPFRVFNFGMGGADLATYPLLYRYARLVARPKQIWVATPVSWSPPQVRKGSLDELLLMGPLGRHFEHPSVFAASFWFHEIPMVRHAAAMRDAVVHLKFAHRPITNLDIYQINPHGDTVSWLYNVEQYEGARKLRAGLRDTNLKFVQTGDAERKKLRDKVFNPRMISALADLMSLAQQDGASIAVIPFDLAVGLSMRDQEYLDACAPFFDSLSRYLGARAIDVRPSFEVKPYMVSDAMHMNTIGSTEFSRLLAARMAGKPDPVPVRYAASGKIMNSEPDPKWTTFTAMITKAHDEPSGTLELHFLQNWGLQLIRPDSFASVAVRLADEREFVLPARAMGSGIVLADASGLPLAAQDQILTAQIVPQHKGLGAGLTFPVASYRWSADRHPAEFYAPKSHARVAAGARTFAALEQIRASWSGVENPTPNDWIGAFPAGKPEAARVAYAYTKKASAGSLDLPVLFTPGRYELQLHSDVWGSIAVSEPFDVVAVTAKVQVVAPNVAADGFIDVAWSDLNYAHDADWVGLFADGTTSTSLASRRTGGTRSGTVRLPVGKTLTPGDYEVRLLSSGGWTVAGRARVSIVPPPAGDAAHS